MIGITKLLCGTTHTGDTLRYGRESDSPSEFSSQRKPVVVWNFLRRCNLHCVHCYSASQDKDYPGELTTNEGLAFIASLAQYGVPVLLFSGGEPFLRPDLFSLAQYAVAKGIRTVISTNGTLITPAMAQKVKESGISYVGVSLDGLEEINDRFRGKKGAFQEALRGIRNCRDAGVRMGLRFTITKRNFNQINNILDLVEEEDIPRLCFYHLVYSGRGSQLMAEDLTSQETRQVMDLIIAKALDFHSRGLDKEILTVDNYADAVYLYHYVKREYPSRAPEVLQLLRRNGGNSSGVGIGDVDNLGNVHADQFWQHHSFGNIRERPFAEIWEDTSDPTMSGLKNKRGLIKGRCAHCQYFDLCAGNLRVRAEARYGDIWAEDPACYLSDEEIGIA
ncbi:MAG: radical SAM protein [Chloroflexi bacterium]|nr:radical SAM protein [Chloroflexota bacterium]